VVSVVVTEEVEALVALIGEEADSGADLEEAHQGVVVVSGEASEGDINKILIFYFHQ
jgi:hypothetical protein